jgi:hypothetical protein
LKNWNVRFGKLVNRSSRLRAILCSSAALISFLFSPIPKAFGVTPAPDGGFAGRISAEGTDALFSWTNTTLVGEDTAVGYEALYKNTNGTYVRYGGGLAFSLQQHQRRKQHGGRSGGDVPQYSR